VRILNHKDYLNTNSACLVPCEWMVQPTRSFIYHTHTHTHTEARDSCAVFCLYEDRNAWISSPGSRDPLWKSFCDHL